MKKIFFVFATVLILTGCNKTSPAPLSIETPSELKIQNPVSKISISVVDSPVVVRPENVPTESKVLSKSGVTMILDSTFRQSAVLVDGPMSQESVNTQNDTYMIEIVSVPECGGSSFSPRIVSTIQNDEGYNYVIASVKQDELTPSLQEKLTALRAKDPECGYVPSTSENQAAIEALLKEYKETYQKEHEEVLRDAIRQL